jgi:hypothetical protein
VLVENAILRKQNRGLTHIGGLEDRLSEPSSGGARAVLWARPGFHRRGGSPVVSSVACMRLSRATLVVVPLLPLTWVSGSGFECSRYASRGLAPIRNSLVLE